MLSFASICDGLAKRFPFSGETWSARLPVLNGCDRYDAFPAFPVGSTSFPMETAAVMANSCLNPGGALLLTVYPGSLHRLQITQTRALSLAKTGVCCRHPAADGTRWLVSMRRPPALRRYGRGGSR